MSNLTSSIVRGFGFTIGKRAANSMLDNRNVSNGSTKHSTFTVWFGTFLFGSFLGAIIGLVLYGMTKLDVMVFVGLVVGYFLMYKYYTSQNKKYDQKVNEYRAHRQEAEKIIKNIEQQYVNEEITKREYEILMKDANKLLVKIQNGLVVLILSIFIVSCSSPEQKLLSKLEDHLIKNMKDPKSYEKISSKLDTFYVAQQLEFDKIVARVEGKQSEVVRIQKLIDNTDPKKIDQIIGKFEYRAKNGFGALDIGKSNVYYNPEKDEIVRIK